MIFRRSLSTYIPPTKPSTLRHLFSINDLSRDELLRLTSRARELKSIIKHGNSGNPLHSLLAGQCITLLFSKRSTRTRISTESSVALLGGSAMFLGKDDIQLNVNETLYDTSRVIGSMSPLIIARGTDEEVRGLMRWSGSPVINALSTSFHPCQAICDIMTIQESLSRDRTEGEGEKKTPISSSNTHNSPDGERKGMDQEDIKVAWVGDGNNVINDLLLACAKIGWSINIATPRSHDMDPEVLHNAREMADEHGSRVLTTHDPRVAVEDADFVVTDTWISMGQESEREAKLRTFEGYQVDDELLGLAKSSAKFMHCLPRHPEEVSDEVFYGPRSIVFEEAENRKWAMMAILEWIWTCQVPGGRG